MQRQEMMYNWKESGIDFQTKVISHHREDGTLYKHTASVMFESNILCAEVCSIDDAMASLNNLLDTARITVKKLQVITPISSWWFTGSTDI